MNSKIKNIAIVGYGNIAKKHLSILLKLLPNSNFFIVSKRKHESRIKKIKFFKKISNLEKISIDLALICSSANKHYNDFLFFYKKKSNILIEKPLTKNVLETKKIFQYSKSYKKLIEVGYVLRHTNSGKKFKNLLDRKLIGKI